jgi:hypothetical protein
MSAKRSGGRPDNGDAGTWASESVPLSVRKEMLERELNKLGFRRAGAQGTSSPHDGANAQQQGDAGSSHPQADSNNSSEHGD